MRIEDQILFGILVGHSTADELQLLVLIDLFTAQTERVLLRKISQVSIDQLVHEDSRLTQLLVCSDSADSDANNGTIEVSEIIFLVFTTDTNHLARLAHLYLFVLQISRVINLAELKSLIRELAVVRLRIVAIDIAPLSFDILSLERLACALLFVVLDLHFDVGVELGIFTVTYVHLVSGQQTTNLDDRHCHGALNRADILNNFLVLPIECQVSVSHLNL